jgi:hypothetical protein
LNIECMSLMWGICYQESVPSTSNWSTTSSDQQPGRLWHYSLTEANTRGGTSWEGNKIRSENIRCNMPARVLSETRHQQVMPAMLAPWEAEIRRILVQSQDVVRHPHAPGQISKITRTLGRRQKLVWHLSTELYLKSWNQYDRLRKKRELVLLIKVLSCAK